MRKHYFPLVLPLAAAFLAVGCVDDNYDLANIDTSVEVPVNDLVIPVNFNPVTLNSIIDLDNSESITKEKTSDGKEIYVYTYSGDFGEGSKDIRINDFKVNAPKDINPSVVHVNLLDNAQARRKVPGLGNVISYNMNHMSTKFSYKINDVDSKVSEIESVVTPKVTFSTSLSMPKDVMGSCKEIEIKNVKMKFPKGLYTTVTTGAKSSLGKYDAETGELTIPSFKTTDGKIDVTLTAEIIDIEDLGIKLKDNKFDFDGEIIVDSGQLDLITDKDLMSFPTNFDVDIDYDFSSFEITKFSGVIDYNIDAPDFKPADLTDIPDFLAQDETKIKLANPQIYISIDNTCAPYGLGGSAGLEITPIRNDVDGNPIKMDEKIVIGHNKGVGPYKYAISPEGKDLQPIAEYSDATKYLFSELGNVLYGNGLPQKLEVDFIDPKIEGQATNFPLGQNIPSVKGNYTFRAPLALADGSQIVYSGTEDDWHSDALEDLYVRTLELTANVTSTVPLAVKLTANILDKEGKHIGVATANEVPAMAQNYPLTITITPDAGSDFISGIDGIFYEAWAISNTPADEAEALSPDQTLKLDDIRAKVSGKYVHLDKKDK